MHRVIQLHYLILIIFLGACSSSYISTRSPSSKITEGVNCKSVLNQVRRLTALNNSKNMPLELRSQIWDWITDSNSIDAIDNYIDLIKLNFSSDEISKITQPFRGGELTTDRMNYLIWAGGQAPKRRKVALSELALWENPNETKQLKKFIKARKKFDQWEEKKFKDLLAESDEGTDTQIIKAQAKAQRQSYERLKYACSAKIPNTENAAAGKNFSRFILTVGPMSVAAGYTVANWSELESAWAQMQEGEGAPLKSWFKQLGYDLSIGIILNYTIGRIFSEPTGSYLQKVIKGYGADLVIGTADMFAYNILFPKDKQEMQKRFDDLKTDPEFQDKMKILRKKLDEVGFVAKFKTVLLSKIRELIAKGDGLTLKSVDLENLKSEDLDKPEVQKLVMTALASDLYFEGRYGAEAPDWSEQIIQTGDSGSDRLLFYGSIGPVYHGVNILIGTRIYQTICMGKSDLKQAFAKAALMHTIWSFSYNLFEFPLRNRLINQ